MIKWNRLKRLFSRKDVCTKKTSAIINVNLINDGVQLYHELKTAFNTNDVIEVYIHNGYYVHNLNFNSSDYTFLSKIISEIEYKIKEIKEAERFHNTVRFRQNYQIDPYVYPWYAMWNENKIKNKIMPSYIPF